MLVLEQMSVDRSKWESSCDDHEFHGNPSNSLDILNVDQNEAPFSDYYYFIRLLASK